ncbi:MAG: class I SAM-dependent methyltransferase [Chloroherpetonaceae bacterium]|nr:class I SAM-dependent methyltransferase [Chloroherpetonaceae bacterium]MDW8438188.1 class I SAM-dependent methyltransferase [Chloroherpetonaceae bacterium]
MRYDPIKRSIGDVARKSPLLRKVLYFLLGLLFLREWYVKAELRKILSKSNGKSVSVLDAGSGFGQYAYFIAKTFKNASVCAVDVKAEQIDDCHRFFQQENLRNATFAVQDLTTIERENEFDVILSVDVMEHILEDEKVFRNFYRALKPGGVLIVNTPSDLSEDHDHHGDGSSSFIEEHVRDGYSPKELAEKLAKAGFENARIAYTYGFWGNLYWHLALKYPMMMLGVSKAFFLVLPIYYLFTFPFALLFMLLDFSVKNETGTGLMAVAKKQ